MSLSVRLVFSYRASQPTTKFRPILRSRFPTSTLIFPTNERHVNGFSGPGPGQIGPQDEEGNGSDADHRLTPTTRWSPTFFKIFESAATTFVSILVLA